MIDNATEASDRRNLSHLRRVIRDEHVPKALVSTDAEKRRLKGSDGFAGLERSQDVFILLCRKSVLAYDLITDLLSELNPCDGLASDQMLQTISVPLSPPSSEQEAGLWSEEYWPTIYKRSNPHGPQHNEIEQAAKQIRAKVWSHMDLAGRIGQASADHGCGESFGAVVVDRSGPAAPIVVAAAGDARWTGQGTRDKSLNGGNAMAHAVMRVIGMIAKKRRACSADAQALESDKDNEEWFAEACLTSLERQVYSASSIAPGGYLCVDMELYVTHEPCVMCCMALLHSRFRKVVFKEQMPNTGGLVAEELFQGRERLSTWGLFWRPSLNWKFLAWQWSRDGDDESSIESDSLHV